MKRFLLLLVGLAVIGFIGFVAGGWFFTKGILDKYNGMASENFATALALFRDGYQAKRIPIFGESEEHSKFVIDSYEFVVIPGSKTTSNWEKEPRRGVGNMAAHANDMAVMLACKWIDDGDPRGEQLLENLREILPNFRLSAPNLGTVPIKDLEIGSEMMKSQANQWSWRMGDLHVAEPRNKAARTSPLARQLESQVMAEDSASLIGRRTAEGHVAHERCKPTNQRIAREWR